MEKPYTVNKIGGEAMGQMDKVLKLVRHLQEEGEAPILVVSAFKGVTDKLIEALDVLDRRDYTEVSIRTAFGDAMGLISTKIDEFIIGEQAKDAAHEHIRQEMCICVQTLLTHLEVTNVLAPSAKTNGVRDKIIGFGERIAVLVLEAYLNENGISARAIENVIYRGNGDPDDKITRYEFHRGIQRGLADRIKPQLPDLAGKVWIIGGHIAGALDGMVPRVGRSYTDATAVDVTEALERNLGRPVAKTKIWKNVRGVSSSNKDHIDPAVNHLQVHAGMSFNESLELAGNGAEVVQIDALRLALRERIALSVGDIDAPHEPGTTFSVGETITEYPFKIVDYNDNIDMVSFDIPATDAFTEFTTILLEAFRRDGIKISDIIHSQTSISFAISLPTDDADRKELRKKIAQTTSKLQRVEIDGEIYECTPGIDQSKAKIFIIGDELKGSKGILGVIAAIMAAEGINISGNQQEITERSLYFYVNKKDAARAVQALHRVFIDKDKEYARATLGRVGEIAERYLI